MKSRGMNIFEIAAFDGQINILDYRLSAVVGPYDSGQEAHDAICEHYSPDFVVGQKFTVQVGE